MYLGDIEEVTLVSGGVGWRLPWEGCIWPGPDEMKNADQGLYHIAPGVAIHILVQKNSAAWSWAEHSLHSHNDDPGWLGGEKPSLCLQIKDLLSRRSPICFVGVLCQWNRKPNRNTKGKFSSVIGCDQPQAEDTVLIFPLHCMKPSCFTKGTQRLLPPFGLSQAPGAYLAKGCSALLGHPPGKDLE